MTGVMAKRYFSLFLAHRTPRDVFRASCPHSHPDAITG